MRRWNIAAVAVMATCISNASGAADVNPLVGTWILDRYVDTPAGGAPITPFGARPSGLFVFTADGHVSISMMRNPPDIARPTTDPDPDACVPGWYCSYFGTYTYEPGGSTWTTHVTGGNIPAYVGTDQKRGFAIKGDVLTISENYIVGGRFFSAERMLQRAAP